MRRVVVSLSLLAVLALPVGLFAHEGHQHTVMGTVVQVHAAEVAHVELKTTDGQTVVLTCDGQTKFLKGKAVASLKDVTAGARIVAKVTTEGKTTKAAEIQIGAGGAAASPAPSPHHH
jgi:hypothetical protein